MKKDIEIYLDKASRSARAQNIRLKYFSITLILTLINKLHHHKKSTSCSIARIDHSCIYFFLDNFNSTKKEFGNLYREFSTELLWEIHRKKSPSVLRSGSGECCGKNSNLAIRGRLLEEGEGCACRSREGNQVRGTLTKGGNQCL